MKLYVLSDLHVEFAAFSPAPEALEQADVVVLAGDIHNEAHVASWARATFGDKPILWVPGNHEYYGGHWEESLHRMRKNAREEGIIFLEDDVVDIEGVRFLGTALWTDFELFGDQHVAAAMAEARRDMMDYQRILGCTPQVTRERHTRSLTWLEKRLAEQLDPSKTVVITHHAPRRESVEEKYRSSLTTAAFASHLPAELVQKSGLWIHGHMHASKRYRLGNTWVVCNPRGYPRGRMATTFENPHFDPGLLLQQTEDGWQPHGHLDEVDAFDAGPVEIPAEMERHIETLRAVPKSSTHRVFSTEQEFTALCERTIRVVDAAVDMNNNDLVDMVVRAIRNGGAVPVETMQAFHAKGYPAWILHRAQKLITLIYDEET
jgi:Icc-related predicted phosphoesterase